MKSLLFYLPLILCLISCNREKIDLEKSTENTDKSQLRAVYWGIEADDCQLVHQMLMKPGHLKLNITRLESSFCIFIRNPEETCEKISNYFPWGDILEVIDLEAFMKLPDMIVCDTCQDKNIEWIEVETKQGNKKVKFYRGQTIPQIQALQAKINDLKTVFSASECRNP